MGIPCPMCGEEEIIETHEEEDYDLDYLEEDNFEEGWD